MQSLPGAQPSRDRLIDAIVGFLAGQDLLTLKDVRAVLAEEIDRAGPDAVVALKARLTADYGWDYYPPDPLARSIHHRLADRFLTLDSELLGAERVATVLGAPVIVVANHLSYADANVIEVLLQRSRGAALANRLTALAGPKVFSSRERNAKPDRSHAADAAGRGPLSRRARHLDPARRPRGPRDAVHG